ncbi:MAG: IMPACT family protein [Oscillospiraceae bacterium]|nr:IMPACT family protein [Oscillospiraceae bacterium]
MKPYQIPTAPAEAELIEKRSRFIGHIRLVTTEAEALAELKAIRETHNTANHNVYAYIVRENNIIRCSDAGEPQGTAGQPVLNVFLKEEITNVLCVVTRYFGGTLLGAGGLVRAYAQTAKLALDTAGISVVRAWQRIQLTCSYAQYERLQKIAAEQGAVIENTDFAANVTLTLLVPDTDAGAFCAHMVDVSAGTAGLVQLDTQEIPVPLP